MNLHSAENEEQVSRGYNSLRDSCRDESPQSFYYFFLYIYILISLIHDIIITLPIKRIAGNDGRDLCHHCHTIIKKYINTVHDI